MGAGACDGPATVRCALLCFHMVPQPATTPHCTCCMLCAGMGAGTNGAAAASVLPLRLQPVALLALLSALSVLMLASCCCCSCCS